MPALPQYRQQTRATGALPQMGEAPNVAAIAGAVADRVNQNVERVAEHDDNVDVAKGLAELRMKAAKRMDEGEANAAPDAAGFTQERMKEFDADLEEVTKLARSPRAQAVLKEQSQTARAQIYERSLGFEASRRSAYRTDAAQAAVETSRSLLELDPTQYEAVRAEQLGSIPTLGLEPAQRLALARNIETNLAEGAAIGVAKNDPREALAKLATPKSGDARFDKLSADARRRLETFAKGKLAEAQADAIVNAYRVDTRAGTKALVELSKSDLPPEILNDVRSQVSQGLGQLHFERRQQFNEQVTALERSISQDNPGVDAESKAAALYHRGAYSAEQYTNVLQQIDVARQQGAKKGAAMVTVEAAIRNGDRLDPRDTDIVKAVDTWFTETARINNVAPGSDEWVNSAAAIASRTNILPPEAMSWARKTLLSGEPKLAVPAANAMARFADAAPAAYAFFDDPQLKANAEAIDGMVRAGADPAKAVEVARATTYDIPKPRQEALKATYTKEKFAADNAGVLGDLMDGDDAFEVGLLGTAPPPPIAMQDEYNGLVRTYFDYTNGDIKRARALAWKDIRGTYGVSTVNGEPEVLKYAPELVFPGIDPKVIQSDVSEAAKGAKVETPVKLTPARVTGDTHGLLWQLTTVDKDGYEEVLLDEKNRPLVYAIPTDTAVYVKAQEEAKQKAVEAAREQTRKSLEVNAAVAELGAYPGY